MARRSSTSLARRPSRRARLPARAPLQYMADAWKTFQDEKIAERIFKIVASRAPKEDMEKFQEKWDEMKEALEPINGQALLG